MGENTPEEHVARFIVERLFSTNFDKIDDRTSSLPAIIHGRFGGLKWQGGRGNALTFARELLAEIKHNAMPEGM